MRDQDLHDKYIELWKAQDKFNARVIGTFVAAFAMIIYLLCTKP